MEKDAINGVVEVPYWAWLVLGGVLSVVGSQALKFFLDLAMLFIRGKVEGKDSSGRSQIDRCHETCQPAWEKAISEALLQMEIRFGARVDAKLDQALNRLHERLDGFMDAKGR